MTAPVFPAFIKLEASNTDKGKSDFLKAVDQTMRSGEARTADFAATSQANIDRALKVPPGAASAFTAEVDRMAVLATSKLESFAASARRNLDAALSGKMTASGTIDLDVAGARQAAQVAEQRAAVARQLAEATKAAALAERDFSQATRFSISAMKQLAQEETEAAATARAQADATARLQAAMDRAGVSAKGLAGANDNVTRTAGAQRQGMMQLGYQLSDVATMWSLGAKPAQIFASQIGQITQAVQLMAGGTSRLATFMMGPWGVALSTAAIVAGPFIAQLYEMVTGADTARSALQKLIDKQREAAVGAMDDTQALIGLNQLRDKRLKIQTELDKVNSGKKQGPLGYSPVTLQKQLREINLQIAEAEGALAASETRRAEIERKGTSTTVEATKAVTGHGRATRATTAAVQDQAKAVSELDKILAAMTATLKDVQAATAGDITKPYDRMLERLGAGQSEAVMASREASDATADWNDRLSETVRLLEQIGGTGSALGNIGHILGSLSGGNLGALPGPAGIIGKALGGVTWQTVDGDGNRMVRQLGDEFASVLDDVFGSRGSFSKVLEAAGIGSAAGQAFLGSKGNNAGSAIGGILGEVAGKALGKGIGGALGSAMGPIGSVLGGVLGGALGSAFKKTTSGFAVISNRGVTSGGNNRELAQGAQNTGDSISAQLQSIAERLGGSVGDYAVSIGTRSSGWIRVSASGSSDVAGKNFYKSPDAIYNGKDPAEAARIALLNALQDGAIQGIRDGAKRLLQTGKDVERALNRALSFEQVFKDLKAFKDPTGAALDTLNLEFRRLIDIFKEAGASTAEMAQLEELYGIRRADAVRDANERILGSLKGLKEYLTVGSDFYSLRDRQAQAEAIYNPLKARVQAGDATAFDAFSKASQDLLEIERQINGSTSAFYVRADEIRALTDQAIAGKQAVSAAAAASDSPFTALASQQQATTSAIDNQTAALLAALGGINDNLVASLRARIDATGQSNTAQYTGLFAPRGSW